MFKEEEGEHFDPDYDNTLVVLLGIINLLVKRILIDIKSYANILYYDVF